MYINMKVAWNKSEIQNKNYSLTSNKLTTRKKMFVVRNSDEKKHGVMCSFFVYAHSDSSANLVYTDWLFTTQKYDKTHNKHYVW